MKRPTKKKAAARRQATPSTSTALARRQTLAIEVVDPGRRLPEILPAPRHEGIIGSEASTGELGLVEVKLTPAEEAVLARPVNDLRVLVKPTGQPYLSHPEYTRWFNEAFGRLGWALVQKAQPIRQVDGNKVQIICPYVLYIHRQPAAFAWGEQEYWSNNKEQTYGDALEATVASALRRCAKRLGVGLELWDKRWLRAWLDIHTVKVKLEPKRGDREEQSEAKFAWRLKTDPPFWNEAGIVKGSSKPPTGSSASTQPTERRQKPRAGSNPDDDKSITEEQRARLFKIAARVGRGKRELQAWLAIAYDVTETTKIKRKDYDAIVSAIESPNPLPKGPATREPGEEG
jgi:hypothetical protein